MNQVQIHPTALVAPGSEIGADVLIGPYAVVEEETVLGNGCRIGAHAVIKRYTRLGEGNLVAEGAVLGGDPQDLKFSGDRSHLQIGDQNVFREGVTVNRATAADAATRIGDNCYLMAYSHVAHECVLGNHVVLANNVALAGHVSLGDYSFLGGGAGRSSVLPHRANGDDRGQLQGSTGCAPLFPGRRPPRHPPQPQPGRNQAEQREQRRASMPEEGLPAAVFHRIETDTKIKELECLGSPL